MSDLSQDDLDMIGVALRAMREDFRSYEHDDPRETADDLAYAGRISALLERLGQQEDPAIRLRGRGG